MRARTLAGSVVLTGALLSGCGAHPLPTSLSEDPPATTSATASAIAASTTAAPAIGVSPTSFGFLVYAFRPTYNPPSQTLTITNVGGGTLNWKATDNAGWLKLGRTSGTAPSKVSVRVDRASIPIGIYGYRPRLLWATIILSAANAPTTLRTIPVSVSISYER